MLPASVLIQWQSKSRELGAEERLIASHAEALGLPVTFGSRKQVERGRVSLSRDSMVVGGVQFVLHALRQLGINAPPHAPYPPVLAPYLRRKVWQEAHLYQVLSVIEAKGTPLFVKPSDGWKRFTGFVAESSSDSRFLGSSRSQPVWVSNPVRFTSEWRVYVAHGRVLDVKLTPHGGVAGTPDHEVIVKAVQALEDSGTAPRGYVIDFGVLDSGETALVEVNDGFSFGAYGGVAASVVFDVAWARWQELMSEADVRLPGGTCATEIA